MKTTTRFEVPFKTVRTGGKEKEGCLNSPVPIMIYTNQPVISSSCWLYSQRQLHLWCRRDPLPKAITSPAGKEMEWQLISALSLSLLLIDKLVSSCGSIWSWKVPAQQRVPFGKLDLLFVAVSTSGLIMPDVISKGFLAIACGIPQVVDSIA